MTDSERIEIIRMTLIDLIVWISHASGSPITASEADDLLSRLMEAKS